MKNTNKILGVTVCIVIWAVCIALIGTGVNAQPEKVNATYVENITNDYINSSGINLTDYTLRVVPRAVPEHGKKMVNVFLFPENSTKWTIKFRVDLNSGTVVNEAVKEKPALFWLRKSEQNRTRIKEALNITKNDSEMKKQFAVLNFTRIPHVQSFWDSKAHIIFVPMNAYEKVKSVLERKHNVTVIDVNVSIADKKIIRSEIKEIKEHLKEIREQIKENRTGGSNKDNNDTNNGANQGNGTNNGANQGNGTNNGANNGNKDSGGKSKDKD